MLLDQQVTMEKAFHSPYDLKERLGGRLDAAEIAAMDPDKLQEVFAERPALHRFPGSMAGRTQELANALVEHYDGRAERVWETAKDGDGLLANLKALPGFGDQKAKIFVALLAKRMGVQPQGWEEAAGFYGQHGCYSVADVDGPDTLAKVREYKLAAARVRVLSPDQICAGLGDRSASSQAGRAVPCPASRPCGRRSTGVMSCSATRSACCSVAWRYLPVGGPSTPSSRCVRATGSTPTVSSTF